MKRDEHSEQKKNGQATCVEHKKHLLNSNIVVCVCCVLCRNSIISSASKWWRKNNKRNKFGSSKIDAYTNPYELCGAYFVMSFTLHELTDVYTLYSFIRSFV